jgi:2-keto-4-pentenoate hydratase/2-oxohepta-3-ene-1,7-dioic acid hydratase in catechol pathway
MAKSAGYKIATYRSKNGPRAALVIEDRVFDAAALTDKAAYATVIGILADWKSAQATLQKAAARAGKGGAKSRSKSEPLAKTKLLAPVQFPSAIYCAGANYADHVAEMAARDGRPIRTAKARRRGIS